MAINRLWGGFDIALIWLWGGLAWLEGPPERAVGTTKYTKNTKSRTLDRTELPTGRLSGVSFVSHSFFVCLVYFVVQPATSGLKQAPTGSSGIRALGH